MRLIIATAMFVFLVGAFVPAYAQEETKIKSVLEGTNIKKIVYVTAIYSPKGIRKNEDRVSVFINNPKILKQLEEVLAHYPVESGTYKRVPLHLPYWKVYIEGESRKIIALDIYGVIVKSPLNATVIYSPQDRGSRKLLQVLKKGIQKQQKK